MTKFRHGNHPVIRNPSFPGAAAPARQSAGRRRRASSAIARASRSVRGCEDKFARPGDSCAASPAARSDLLLYRQVSLPELTGHLDLEDEEMVVNDPSAADWLCSPANT